jgi:hypothetical protein
MTAHKTNKNTSTPQKIAGHETPGMAITVDYERYAHMLDDPTLSETAKQEFLQTLWNIIIELIDIGVAVHAKGDDSESCGQLAQDREAATTDGKSAVHCKNHSTKKPFISAASGEERGA